MFRIVAVCVVLCFAAAGAAAAPSRMPAGFDQCMTLDECLRALDPVAPQRANGSSWAEEDAAFMARLETFGRPAKLELLKRAASDDRGWRNLAGAILMDWSPLGPQDVPALIAALRKDPGGWVARPLGRLGTDEAVAALVQDVRQHGAANQSGVGLTYIGDRVFPYLLPLLSDDRQWNEAAFVLRQLGPNAIHGLDGWLAIALDEKRPEPDRVGALRGIGILGTSAREVAPKLRALLKEYDNGRVTETAQTVLAAMGDRTMAAQTILACGAAPSPFDDSFESTTCLEQAAYYESGIFPYANLVLSKFTNSPNGTDRANGASLLGFIGYAPAKQRLTELLADPDWRVVYAATRALGWLKAKDAIPALTRIADGHWLADVRRMAATTIAALQAGAALPRPEATTGTLDFPPRVPLELDATFAPDVAPCASGRWTWRGKVFGEANGVSMTLRLPEGELVGRDSGEWGGEVLWKTASQEPSFVAYGNVEGIERTSGGAVAVIGGGGVWTDYDASRKPHPGVSLETITISNGAGGSGYALSLRRDASGAWRVQEIARFPRAGFGLTRIGSDLFAVWSGNRAIVFGPGGIAGVAACVAAP